MKVSGQFHVSVSLALEQEPSVCRLGEGEVPDPVEMPVMEPRFFGCPTRRVVAVLTELFLLPKYIQLSH